MKASIPKYNHFAYTSKLRRANAANTSTKVIALQSTLIVQAKQGNRKAQYQLYNQYCKAMYNICVRMLNSKLDAEDVLQDAFINAFKNLPKFRGESTFGAWLKRIVVNHCINFLRKKRLNFTSLDDKAYFLADTSTTENTTVSKYDMTQIRQAIQLLPDGYRVVFTLYLIEGYDHKEIAQILRVAESTSKSQYNRAKTRLRKILQQLNV